MELKHLLLMFCLFFISSVLIAKDYYINPGKGNDESDGLSKTKAWKSLNKVSSFTFLAGDSILFQSGEIFYEKLVLNGNGTAENPIFIGRYGHGTNPEIRNARVVNQWENIGNSLWGAKDNELNQDVGAIFVLDYSGNVKYTYWQKRNEMKDVSVIGDFWGNGLSGNGYFAVVKSPNNISPILISGKGTQVIASLHDNSIAIKGNRHIIIDGLAIRFGGSHGISISDNAQNIVVRNCNISYIGGCEIYTGYNGRYGNGIEIWGSADGVLIEKNRIWEIYDTGFTHQYSGPLVQYQRNIVFRNNIVSNVGLSSIESWNTCSVGIGSMENIYVENNTFHNSGIECWACDQQNRRNFFPNTGKIGAHYAFLSSNARITDFYIRNNIFSNSYDMMIFVNGEFNHGNEYDSGFYEINSTNNLFYNELKTINQTRILVDMHTAKSQNLYALSFYAGDFKSLESSYPRQHSGKYGNPHFKNANRLDFLIDKRSAAYEQGVDLSNKSNYPTGIDYHFSGDISGYGRLQNGTMDIGAAEVK